jgi:hypothetical protein
MLFMLLQNDTVSNIIERFGIDDVVNSDERKKIGILFSSIYLLVKYLLVKSLMFYQLWLALRLEEMNKTVGKIQIDKIKSGDKMLWVLLNIFRSEMKQ